MGPTNIALVKLFRADQALREAQERYDHAARSVRLLERRVNDLSARVAASQQSLREQQSQAAQLDLDLKARDARIEKLRTQQQQANTNKEYQAFLTEINTEKVDRNKVEDQAIAALEVVERTQGELKVLQTQLAEEQKKLDETKNQLGAQLAELQTEIDAIQPGRDEAYAAVSPKAKTIYDRVHERHDGEAMSPLEKPDARHEEYICGACNMALVVDIYNRLHSRDDLVMCPNCGRILFIPDELPPEVAVNKTKEKKDPRSKSIGAAPPRQTTADAVVNSVMVEETPESGSPQQ